MKPYNPIYWTYCLLNVIIKERDYFEYFSVFQLFKTYFEVLFIWNITDLIRDKKRIKEYRKFRKMVYYNRKI